MTLRHWQMEKVASAAEPLLSTTGNKGLNRSSGANINYDSTALFGKFSVESKHFFDTDAAGSLSDNEFTAAFWFYVPTGTESRYIFQLGLYNTDVSLNGHTCVGLLYSYYSNKIFFTTGYKNASGGLVELGGLSRNVWHHCYISRTNSGANSTLQVKITATDGTVVHDKSEVYTKADFSIDETGTGQYSYFNGHPAGGSLTLSNGRIEDFILKNGSVLSYSSIYNSSAEVFQSDEPQVSVSTGAGSATLSDSNFTGTKTYSFYDTDATTLLQSGPSNSYTSYASSSVAYTALVSDDNNNRVISTFFISQGGNDMTMVSQITGSQNIVNVEMLGGIAVLTGAMLPGQTNAGFTGPAGQNSFASIMTAQLGANPSNGKLELSGAFQGHSGTIIQALNFLNQKAESGDLASGSVGSGELAPASVITGKIASQAVFGANIVTGTLRTYHYSTGSVQKNNIATGSINQEQIASGSVKGAHIGALAVSASALAADAVTTNKILDANVTLAKLANAAANTVIVRDADDAGVLSAKAVTNTQILIGNGAGFTAASLGSHVSMANNGNVTISDNVVDKGMLTTDVAGAGLTGGNDTALALSGNVTNNVLFGMDAGTGIGRLQITGSNEHGAGEAFALTVVGGILTVRALGWSSLE